MPKTIFISGTNSGFGRLTALRLAERGHRVLATMRNVQGVNHEAASRLRATPPHWPGRIEVYEMDLAEDESVEVAVQRAEADAGHIDVAINNAAFTMMGLAETITDQQLLYQMDVNLVGPHRLLRAVLPGMRARRSGLLVHVSASLGRMILPAMGAFCASKAAFEALVDCYRYELRPLGIDSTIVQPGFFPTGFADRIEVGDDFERARGYDAIATRSDELGARIAEMIDAPDAPDPRLVVDAIVALIDGKPGERPDRVVVDPINGHAVEAVNEAHRKTQPDFLAGLGMADLA